MADSDRVKAVEQWRRWKRAHPDWPLSVASNGQWLKKVRGRFHSFGPLEHPDDALTIWLAQKDYLLAGIDPPSASAGSGGELTLDSLLKKHMADCESRVAAGKMSKNSLKDFRVAKRHAEAAKMLGYPVNHLGPTQFGLILQQIEKAKLKPRTERKVIMSLRTVLNWGVAMELCERPRYGPRFVAPSMEVIEAEQEERGEIRFFDRTLLLAALAKANPRMKVAILLGINCGFYAQDTETLTLDHLHLDHTVPHHDLRRVKTKRRRMAALWPETVDVIEDYLRERKAVDRKERRLTLSQFGRRYSGDSGIPHVSRNLQSPMATIQYADVVGWRRDIMLAAFLAGRGVAARQARARGGGKAPRDRRPCLLRLG